MDDATRKQVEARLEKIRAHNSGTLRPDDVVADAKSDKSPLHAFFEWDDSAAAHQFRLDQARTLIRNVKVEMSSSTQTIIAPYYVRDPRVGSDEQGYCATMEIKSDADVATDALRYEFDRAISLLERAVTIADALGLGAQVQELLNRAKVIHGSIPVTEKQRGKKVAV